MTLPTAEMQFSVAFTFSFALESAAWITPIKRGMASGEGKGGGGGYETTIQRKYTPLTP